MRIYLYIILGFAFGLSISAIFLSDIICSALSTFCILLALVIMFREDYKDYNSMTKNVF